MTIVDKYALIHYRLLSISIQCDGANVVAVADIAVLNADGQRIDTDNPSTTLTAAEKTVLAAFITRELGVYETATGLTEWTGE